MSGRSLRGASIRFVFAFLLLVVSMPGLEPLAQSRRQAPRQRVDEEYTAKIKEYTQDPRIITELVDHLPASDTVPTPLKFFGRMPGTPGELTYAKDIYRYYEAIDKASDRIAMWTIGKTEEGRDMVLLAVADESTIRDIEKYKGMLAALTDPRKTTEDRAQQILQTAKPIYWITSGMHSPENGGPEMLIELPYRLAVGESPFIQQIRNNVITIITPVIEVDGREKQVDTYYFNKKRPQGEQRLPLMYWGKYVAHDNNRDGMGQFLALTRDITKTFLEWTPQVMHDLHESVSYLYSSTGTGPYNEWLDAITVNEWWTMAQADVMELTKRGVPGVWTYGFYDGWTPNYLFFAAHAHNAIGRFYEVQRYGPDNVENLRVGATTTSREWFRPNPPLPSIKWGPRNSVNIGESGVLFSLEHFANNRAQYLENYWLKNKRSVDKGRTGPTYAWVIPADQRRKADAAAAVNELFRQGLEIHRADDSFELDGMKVNKGDFIIRGDQPYRTLADMYFSVQNFSPSNPRPYDDTGWTFQLMRNVVLHAVTDTSIFGEDMTRVTALTSAPGGISGRGDVVVVDHTTDNNLATMRWRLKDVPMTAAEADFEVDGRKFSAGSFIIANANRATLEPVLSELGLTGYAMRSAPSVKQHDLDLPRIGYVHSWQRTQDEGWVRAAFDTYGIPYDYFAGQELRKGGLRAKYDVIILPHIGGSATSQVNGIAKNTDDTPLPYKRTAETPNLGGIDESDDIRGGMGYEGLQELYKFVNEGGTLITEGATSLIFPEYNLTTGITIEEPADLFARGSVMRGVVSDRTSPITYGYNAQVPVYFSQSPVINAGGTGGGFGGFGGRGGNDAQQNTTPMANRVTLSTWDWAAVDSAPGSSRGARGARANAAGGAAAGGRGGRGGDDDEDAVDLTAPRVVLSFPSNPADMLLSGTLAGGEALANRAQVVDAPIGDGHVVMFAIRPFWRWQTHGTFFLAFNSMLHWNDLNAGRMAAAPTAGEGNSR
ncbi:MAG TPA: M14 family zinc carboxypeptidase [Gemmatimonadaceae bacterium]|nr:M14 family zinc carboxypeptidase [Gemmatimonadaceae bacterium]